MISRQPCAPVCEDIGHKNQQSSFICPKVKYGSKYHQGCKYYKHPDGKDSYYGFDHMERANIAPRIAPSMQAPIKSFMSISPLKVAPVGAGY
jgi:hypothetical protein